MKIIVLGAGAWGSAVAMSAAQHPAGHAVTLWARDAAQAQSMRAQEQNARYLPGIALPPSLSVVDGDFRALLPGADLVIVATPMAALRGMLLALRGCTAPVAWLCKGFEAVPAGANSASFGLLAHEVQAQVAPDLIAGVFSGPSFAQEVALGQPTALVAASAHAAVRDALVETFHNPTLRVYANDDIVGVEVGGAVKNVLAIATGLCDGLNLGPAAQWLLAETEAEQKRLADVIQQESFENVPVLPLGQFFIASAYRTGLSGFVPGTGAYPWNIRRG